MKMVHLITALIIVAIVLAVVLFFLKVEKKPTTKVHRVGVLCGLTYLTEIINGLKNKMKELGYTEGVEIVYDIETTEFNPQNYRNAIQKFLDEKVDVIVVFPTEAAMEAKSMIIGTGIQEIFVFANIEDTGLVDSISRPGNNITGVRYPGPDIALKRMEITLQLVPGATRILVPYQRGYPIVRSQLSVIKEFAEEKGIRIIELPADNSTELEQSLYSLDASKIDAILAIAEPLLVTPDAFSVLCNFAMKNKIPIGGAYIKVGDCESIFGVNVDIYSAGRDAAILLDKVLKGENAGEIPVITSESYFEISPRAAQNIGIIIPESLLNSANKIIY